jgi:hypothetical protein
VHADAATSVALSNDSEQDLQNKFDCWIAPDFNLHNPLCCELVEQHSTQTRHTVSLYLRPVSRKQMQSNTQPPEKLWLA